MSSGDAGDPAHRRVERLLRWRPHHGADPSVAAAGRAWVRQALRELLTHPPGAEFEGDVELMLSELLTNAVRHGGGVDEVLLRLAGTSLRIVVRDSEPGLPAPADRVHTGEDHGWGMWLIQAFATRWGVQRHVADGKSVWLELPVG
ncbi:ATP-binding protein [Dactylosporangium roseum]|uniref:ATP-binding protein n=1 Tax=Dactylosporangium roseum TaxID=47989 RepID=A0ABY5YVS6_9ACTN|nr:ATP-binding protein [Dactylosporangium roseum]UWZ33848.1 ATP-binding protein [Dactylosporangium roseum]